MQGSNSALEIVQEKLGSLGKDVRYQYLNLHSILQYKVQGLSFFGRLCGKLNHARHDIVVTQRGKRKRANITSDKNLDTPVSQVCGSTKNGF